ncbi:monoterpene synthase-like [Camellia sinensis]|uniref:monoterpene synthase-like n=1 Tax=Camellia sinensis TaxID=4442 RepID=UPI001035A348|nr:monoterpene synthase-like [Camellia sinensis]
MALRALFSPFLVSPILLASLQSPKTPTTVCPSKSIRCASNTITIDDHTVTRRSANYPPSFWDYNFVQSLSSDYTEEKYMREAYNMKDEVKGLINGVMDPLAKLELIDAVQRLGLKYHFEGEIKQSLDDLIHLHNDAWCSDDLHATALRFRLLRQHGCDVPKDVFESFKDETGNFKISLFEDVKGLLSLYEASFFGLDGETIIDEAKIFTIANLKNIKGDMSPSMVRKVGHALDMPLHWRLTRVEARWFIETYEQEQNMSPILLEFAKLDYNMVQSVHQKEVGNLARWWVDMGLDKMSFARDRLVEHYLWCSGMVFEPKFGAFRDMGTKIISLITTIDDIYDVYGALHEIELFTDFVDSQKIITSIPHNIRTCLLALFNTVNEIGYWTLKNRGFNIIPYLSKAWADVLKACLKEAKWYHSGYKPTLGEYLDNAVVSIGAPLALFTSYFLTTENINEEALHYIDKLPSIMRCSSMLVRLTNDLGTSSDELARGDNLKAVQCYMNETGASEEVARDYINNLVHETWKTMNKGMFESYPFSEPFLSANPNLGRTAQCFYQYGDGHGIPHNWTKDHLISLLVQPIPLK